MTMTMTMSENKTDSIVFLFNRANTFCISMPESIERWQKILARFEKIGLDVTRWIASNPDSQPECHYDGRLNRGQRGCAHSHISIWKHIVENGLDYALILEDDACFLNNWIDKLDDLTLTRADDWDAIFLNCSEPIYPIGTWQICSEQYLTGGYIISYSGAKRVLEMFANCYYSSDWMTSRLQTYGRCYTYFPWLIIQEGNESTIGSGYEADHAKVVRCLKEVGYEIEEHYIV